MKKVISVLLSAVMILSCMSVIALAKDEIDYTIVNPYECVDWDTWDNYKACLHLHTTASDGDVELYDMLKEYYDHDYDILAVTDHGVINNGWNMEKKTNGIFNGFRKVEPLTEEQYNYFVNGEDRDGRGMIDITGGIECNMAVVSKTHVNGYFTTYGQGVWGKENDYKTATVEIEKAGGYSVINHPGDWVNSNNFPERSSEDWYISYFADIFTTSKTCLGMEICNNTDNCTRSDKILWDNLLRVVIPTGRNIWAFADDDSEYIDEVGRSFEMFVLPENTVENVENAMVNGNFFACCKYLKTPTRQDEFDGDGNVPLVSNIIVNQEENTITVVPDESRNCQSIQWIANGNVISTDYTIDLNDYEDLLGCYVRFQLRGTGGMTYSQAFELKYEGRVDDEIPEMETSTPFGNIPSFYYHSIWYSLLALIIEKLADWVGII